MTTTLWFLLSILTFAAAALHEEQSWKFVFVGGTTTD